MKFSHGELEQMEQAAKNRADNSDRCVCCGAYVPEGRMVCPICEKGEKMSTKEILEYFKDINYAYNDSTKYDTLERMLSELEEEKGEKTMTIKIKLDEGAKMPTRAHSADAGLDLYARKSAMIFPSCSCVFDTGVHVAIPEGYVGFLKSKSGLNVKYGLTSEGVIDAGYTGSIVVKLYNHGDTPYKVNAGDKITQLVILPIITPEIELVNSLDDTDRGENGFGSSGR